MTPAASGVFVHRLFWYHVPMDGPDQSALVTLRLGHLDMIEKTISRLSGHSATVKNFSLTVFVAVLSLGVSEDEPQLFALAVLVPLIFMCVDAYYLGIERSFRDLYRAVAARALSDATQLGMDEGRPASKLVLSSHAVWPFYILQVALAGAVGLRSLL